MEISDAHIKEIAEYLEADCRCYFHEETGEIINIPNSVDLEFIDFEDDDDDNPWKELFLKIEEDDENYRMFYGMDSDDKFKIMNDFAQSIDDSKLKVELVSALNRKKPFANFKTIIKDSEAYRQKWFDYRSNRYIEWVKKQID